MKRIFCLVLFIGAFFFTGCPENQKPLVAPTTSETPVATPKPVAEPEKPKTETREYKVGDDKRGHYEKYEIIAAPVSVYFRAGERINYLMIDQAMNLYKATNEHFPKTQEIFMEEIIKANNIKLAQLREGWKYLYDTETGKLMVEKPIEEK